jgi:hypothetical protein
LRLSIFWSFFSFGFSKTMDNEELRRADDCPTENAAADPLRISRRASGVTENLIVNNAAKIPR